MMLFGSALSDEKITAAVAGKQVVKVIVVPAKLVNIVVPKRGVHVFMEDGRLRPFLH